MCCVTENAAFSYYNDKNILIIAVDVDDIAIVSDTKKAIEDFKIEICQKVKIKNLGRFSPAGSH